MARLLLPNLRIPWLTLTLAASFLFVYYGMPHPAEPTVADLLAQGASAGQILADGGGFWRLLWANWVHESPRHLFGNLFLLLNIGMLAELFFYRLDLALIYILGGLGAMVTALLAGPTMVTFGCSGMLFAALWATVVISYRYRKYLKPQYRRFLLWALPIYAVVILAAGFVSPGVSGFAHLGGLLVGGILGHLLIVRHPAGLVPYIWQKVVISLTLLLLVPAFCYGNRTVPYLFVKSNYGATFKAPSFWEIHGQKSPNGDSYLIDNGLGVALLLDSELNGDGQSDENILRHDSELATLVAGNRIWLKETTIDKGFYRYHLAITCPVGLWHIYEPWWQVAVSNLEIGEPERLKDARRRAEAPARSLYDYLAFADELFYFGEYDEGRRLLEQLVETFGEMPTIMAKIRQWQPYFGSGDNG